MDDTIGKNKLWEVLWSVVVSVSASPGQPWHHGKRGTIQCPGTPAQPWEFWLVWKHSETAAGNEEGTLKRVQPAEFIGAPHWRDSTSGCLPQQSTGAPHYSNFYMGVEQGMGSAKDQLG